jgi:fructose-bisphosphate aldolase class I
MNLQELETTAGALVADARGILAADESTGTIKRRFDDIGVENSLENRRRYRELLFLTPNIGRYISGVILYDETLRQTAVNGELFTSVLNRHGLIPGIKVDAGAHPLAGFPGESITEGIDRLSERLQEYRALGARFAKWRAVLSVSDTLPSRTAMESNAEQLARYAALCQANGLVPIVEPEVLMDGTHTLERAQEVTDATLARVFERLDAHRVHLEGIILKPNMVLSGYERRPAGSEVAVATATVQCLRRHVPSAVPGIAFLSGGQSETASTSHLNQMNRQQPLPWKLSFSFGRALQQSALAAWRGLEANVPAAQAAFAKRARLNSLASAGQYDPSLEQAL